MICFIQIPDTNVPNTEQKHNIMDNKHIGEGRTVTTFIRASYLLVDCNCQHNLRSLWEI